MSERSGADVRAIDHVGLTVPDIEEAASSGLAPAPAGGAR
jgi:hypothetical protein